MLHRETSVTRKIDTRQKHREAVMWSLLKDFQLNVKPKFEKLYGPQRVPRLLERLSLLISRYNFIIKRCSAEKPFWDEKSNILITYGDMVSTDDEPPLSTLHNFMKEHLSESFTGVHILPFFPYSSDDGFAVIDFREVNPDLGSWKQIEAIARDFTLMVDLVLNHVSSRSPWFEHYLSGIAPEREYFIEVDPDTDLSAVVRPRTSPLLNPAYTVYGERWVWTTFSSDQIDLNYANPDLLFEMLDILLSYISRGARVVRLDAIAYLWKKIGTSCINLPETHEVVKLMRALTDRVAPCVRILTETNLPHEENISYFGNGDEAHMVYQFPLPPLLLHTLQSGSAKHLSAWAASLGEPPEGCGFLNFTASHDGIGVRPLEGILDDEEIAAVVENVKKCGGLVSARTGEDGSEKPYELNITWFDAMKDPDDLNNLTAQIRRFMCSQAIMLELRGIPAVYFHSLTATANFHEGVEQTGMNRTINRKKWRRDELETRLQDRDSAASHVFRQYTKLLKIRAGHKAFHPDAPQEILELPEALFGVRRIAQTGERLTAISNVTGRPHTVSVELVDPEASASDRLYDLIGGKEISGELSLEPWQTCWLTGRKETEQGGLRHGQDN